MDRTGDDAKRSGFTLVELLVVIALIAIVSSLAIVMLSSSQQESAETANISNLKRLISAIQTYRAMHQNALPNKFDSLVRSDASTAVPADQTITVGFNSQDFLYNSNSIIQVFYTGTDKNDDFKYDDGVYFKGLYEHNTYGFGNSLALARLTQSDVDTLKGVGITTVYDINPDVDAFHGTPSYVERTLAAGGYVAVVNPKAARNGKSVYKDFGVDLSNSNSYPIVSSSNKDLNDTGIANAFKAKRFFVFGIGPNTTWIGDQKCGIQDAPDCQIIPDGYYNKYFLVVAMPGGPNDMTLPYVPGVLDSTGKTPRGAGSWATRTN
jgi:prepilin-type N-terminal cleavage/methylation domain-containing protein